MRLHTAGEPGKSKTRAKAEPAKRWEYLSDSSPKDRPWDSHRTDATGVEEHLKSPGTERWLWKQGKRVEACSPSLGFALTADPETGEAGLRLKDAKFCRVRFCPVCQWRRSLMWQARFHKSLPDVLATVPDAQFLFLTLTVKNCAIEDLRATLSAMGKAWNRFTQRKHFERIEGWIRTVEVTRGADGSAHPHFHALLLVKPSYFKKHYVPQADWRDAWQAAMRLDYEPQVHITKVRTKKAHRERAGDDAAALRAAAAETLKYSVKPSDMLADRDWFLELVRQTFRTRAIASGGVL
ncbi:TPA: protein rep, partial [Stenotrophomonas maltophilia]